MEYELVHEIKNLCRNNQMRDIFFEEVELSVEEGANGALTVHAVVDGLMQKFVFTPI